MKFAVTFIVAVLSAHAAAEFRRVPMGISGTGKTTTYWDCCKPSCSWTGSLNGTSAKTPVRSCALDGSTTVSADTVSSGCLDTGNAYMCNDQQPFWVNSTLSYGYAAASFSGGADLAKCCACFLIQFNGSNKQLVVQVTNTGGDLSSNHFDLAMPGGGVGLFNLGCIKQWNAPTDGWGQRYGGVQSEAECSQLPSVLQPGCKWRFQFLTGLDTSNVQFSEVTCPSQITSITKCK